MTESSWRIALWPVVISGLLYLIAITQTAFYQDLPIDAEVSAMRLLTIGYFGPLAGFVAWYANPLLLLSWIKDCQGRRTASGIAAVGAALLMLLFLYHDTMTWPLTGEPADPHITRYGLGYWLWFASAVVMVSANGRPAFARLHELIHAMHDRWRSLTHIR